MRMEVRRWLLYVRRECDVFAMQRARRLHCRFSHAGVHLDGGRSVCCVPTAARTRRIRRPSVHRVVRDGLLVQCGRAGVLQRRSVQDGGGRVRVPAGMGR